MDRLPTYFKMSKRHKARFKSLKPTRGLPGNRRYTPKWYPNDFESEEEKEVKITGYKSAPPLGVVSETINLIDEEVKTYRTVATQTENDKNEVENIEARNDMNDLEKQNNEKTKILELEQENDLLRSLVEVLMKKDKLN